MSAPQNQERIKGSSSFSSRQDPGSSGRSLFKNLSIFPLLWVSVFQSLWENQKMEDDEFEQVYHEGVPPNLALVFPPENGSYEEIVAHDRYKSTMFRLAISSPAWTSTGNGLNGLLPRVFDFKSNGVLFDPHLHLGNVTVRTLTGGRYAFRHEIDLCNKIMAATNIAAAATRTIRKNRDMVGVQGFVAPQTLLNIEQSYVDALLWDAADKITNATNQGIRSMLGVGMESAPIFKPVSPEFLQKLVAMYHSNRGNLLHSQINILEMISSHLEIKNHPNAYLACLNHAVGNMPLIWYEFEVGKLVIGGDEKGYMVLHGWARSLVGLAHIYAQELENKPLGVVGLSLLSDIAGSILGLPISLIFLDATSATQLVIKNMRTACETEIPYVRLSDIPEMQEVDFEGAAEVLFVDHAFNTCWRQFTTNKGAAAEKRQKRNKIGASVSGKQEARCSVCCIRGTTLYAPDGDVKQGLFCGEDCFFGHNQ
jgi:hypothetical protein